MPVALFSAAKARKPPQTLGAAEAVRRAVAHTELFEAEPAARRIVEKPKLLGPSAALGADEIGPRAPVWELRMSDADEFGLLAEWYEGLLVLEPDHARGLEARYTDAKFVEEDAVVRIASAFRHELKAVPRALCYHTTPECQSIEAQAKRGGLPTFVRAIECREST